MYTMLNSAVIRYSIIQPMTHRVLDSGTIADSGTTGHLTRAHTQDYISLVGRITEMLHTAVLAELGLLSLMVVALALAMRLTRSEAGR